MHLNSSVKTSLLSKGEESFTVSQVTKPVSLFLKEQGNVGLHQNETLHPLLRCVDLGARAVGPGPGVCAEPGLSLTA